MYVSPPTLSLSLSPYIFLSPYPSLTLSLSHPAPPSHHPSLTPSLSHPVPMSPYPSLTLPISPSFVLSPCPLSLPFSLSHPIFHQPLLILNPSTNQPPTTHLQPPHPSLTLSLSHPISIYMHVSPNLYLTIYIFLSLSLTLSNSHPSLSHPLLLSAPLTTVQGHVPIPLFLSLYPSL